jgi:hypothetical protein
MRVELRADRAAQELDGAHEFAAAEDRAGDQVGVAADVFRERVDRQIGPELQRLLEDWAEQGVVAGDDRPKALGGADLVGDAAHEGDIDEGVERVRRRLDHHDRDAALARRLLRRGADALLADAVGKPHRLDPERL